MQVWHFAIVPFFTAQMLDLGIVCGILSIRSGNMPPLLRNAHGPVRGRAQSPVPGRPM